MACPNGFQKKASSPDYAWANWRDVFNCNGPNPPIFCGVVINTLIPISLVNVNQLCSGPPPTPADISITDLLSLPAIVAKIADFTVANMHYGLCECVPDPNNPPPNFTGGQCADYYNVTVRMAWYGPRERTYSIQGPIFGAAAYDRGVYDGLGRYVYVIKGSGPGRSTSFSNVSPSPSQYWMRIDASNNDNDRPTGIQIINIARENNQPDNCGNPIYVGPQPDPAKQPVLPPGVPPPPPGATGATGSVGPAGPAGPAGPPGQNAPPCTPCTDGVDGLPGRDGVDGADGINGLDGIDGNDGLDGLDGVDGLDGADGRDGDEVEFTNITVPIGNCFENSFSVDGVQVSCIVGLESQVEQQFKSLLEIARQNCRQPDLSVGEPMVSYTKSVFPCVVLYFNDSRTTKFGIGRYLQIPNPNVPAILSWVDKNHLYKSGRWMAYNQYLDSKNVQVKAFGLNAMEANTWRNTLHSLSNFTNQDIFHPGQPRETTEKLEYDLYLVRATFFEDNSKKKSGRQTGKLIWEAQ